MAYAHFTDETPKNVGRADTKLEIDPRVRVGVNPPKTLNPNHGGV